MGEDRGKLEALIGDLETKKAELEQLIQEYELMLPHLSSAREALDEAGITDSGSPQPAPVAAAPQPEAAAAAPPPVEATEEEAPAEAGGEAPARRSIASLVAADESAEAEATH